ncbi:transporter substrate-binding domain-containing protein [Burkholderia cenocepacia]|uniref:Uncharacterized protein n=1 Tax=Burkholderia pseudomultivorans TaxID=1207504 RepID=A0A132EUL9_9BURK|nr:transporter substrate-binding domain-containing protein [Burkholderia pseudomultivorans]KWF59841.1 hypothetical protein WT57_28025 [Burkholderia pseudomultivorans]KWI50514.1 hypothetical protein WT72_25515 [Burkholderia pseudomultivorans]
MAALNAVFSPAGYRRSMAIGVRRDDEALRVQINQALASWIQDGTYPRIATKYFSFDIYN